MKRKTSITKIASILTVLAMVWGGGVACQQPTEPEAPVEPTKYTISFDSGVESITVEEGAVATEPTTAPEKTGYTFGGWLNGDAAYDWTQPVTSNLSLTAKWTATEYTITYSPAGVETDNPTTYTIETETFELKAPTKAPDATTPNFVAWHNGEKPAEGEWAIVDSIEKGTTGNLTIVAEFSAKTVYVVTYYIGETKKTQNVEEGKSFSLTGYDLFTDKEFKTAYTAKEVTANIELYAQAKKMTVKFDSNGGSAVAEAKVDYNTAVAKPADPTKEGFDFAGWYEGETKFDFATKITKDISLTAKWEEKKATEPETPAIPTTVAVTKNEDGSFSFADGTYTFVLEGNNPVLKFSMPEEVSCTAGHKLKISGKVNFGEAAAYKQLYIQTLDEASVPLFGYNLITDWNNGLMGEKPVTGNITIGDDLTSFKDCKFVLSAPMTEGETPLINIELKDVVITYEIPDPNAEEVIFDTPQTVAGNVDSFDITAEKFVEYITAGKKTVVFTLLNSADESRSNWGVLGLVSAQTVDPWAWTNLKDNTDLGTNEYGQLSIAEFPAGATGEIEVPLEVLANAVKAVSETNKLVLQTANDALLQSVKIK